jgi:hypothetical protein
VVTDVAEIAALVRKARLRRERALARQLEMALAKSDEEKATLRRCFNKGDRRPS